MTKVLVVASTPMAGAGLTSLLRQTGSALVLHSVSDPSQADHLARSLGADLIVTDVPGSFSPGEHTPPVLALTPGPAEVSESVRGVLPGEPSTDELAAALDAIRAGLLVIHPESLLEVHAARGLASHNPLSPREVQVLRMMAEGRANKEIAFALGITEHTVKYHVSSILDKLEAESRTEAVARGIRQGLVFL